MQWNAALYDDRHNFVFNHGSSLLELLDPQPGETILDLGCGTGHLTQEIHERTAKVVGIDSSPAMISSAQTNFPHLEFQVMDATAIQFETPFDAVFSNAVLHWVLGAEQAVQSMHANLKDNGRVVLEFGGKGNVAAITNALRTTIERFGYQPKPLEKQWFFPSIAEYSALLESHGFEVVSAQLFDRPTELKEASSGIEDWLRMFASGFFTGIEPTITNEIVKEVQHVLRPKLFTDGKWYADYRRIRILAKKTAK